MLYKQFETKSAGQGKVLGISDELGRFLRFGHESGSTPAAAKNIFRQTTAVTVPVNMVAEAFASIIPVIFENGKFITDHPVLDLLRNPSSHYTKELLFESLAKDYLVTGEGHIAAIGNINRPPLELQPIGPENSSPVEGVGGIANSWQVSGNTLAGIYTLTSDKRKARYIRDSLTELKIIRNYSSRDNSLLRGESLLKSASAEARQHIKGNAHNISILESGGRLTLHFHLKSDKEIDDFQKVKNNIRDQYGSTSGERIAVTSGEDMEIKEFGTSNKDMDFVQLQKMAREACALVYKVPLALISTDASTFSNVSEGRIMLYTQAVLPLADRIYAGLTNLLMPRFGLDPAKIQITYNRKSIPALTLQILGEIKLRKEIGVETDNELRDDLGREPYDGGDVVYKPANLIPVGTDLFTDDVSTDLARDGDA